MSTVRTIRPEDAVGRVSGADLMEPADVARRWQANQFHLFVHVSAY